MLRMQLDEVMTKGPLRDTFDVGFPINGGAGYVWPGKLCQWVEVDIVDDGVQDVSNRTC